MEIEVISISCLMLSPFSQRSPLFLLTMQRYDGLHTQPNFFVSNVDENALILT